MSRRPEARAIPSPPTVATVEAPTRAAPGGERRGSPSVAVVGGGFGGIGAALIPRRHGYPGVPLFERGGRTAATTARSARRRTRGGGRGRRTPGRGRDGSASGSTTRGPTERGGGADRHQLLPDRPEAAREVTTP